MFSGKSDVHVSWEPADKLPPAEVREFESGQTPETVRSTSSNYGTFSTTLLKKSTDDDNAPPKKKSHLENILQKNTGYVHFCRLLILL